MLDIFEKASMDNYDIVVLGDLNYDYKIDDDNPINLLENLFSLRQMILKPTRVTSTSSKCLDHILSSIPDKHLISDVAKIALSDHYLIYTCINLQKEVKVKHKVVRFRDYQNFDEKTFIQDLKNCLNLNDILTSNLSVNEMWTKWKTSFDEVCNSHAPMKECRVKDRHNPWITSDVVKLMYKRDYLKKKYDKLKLPHILSEYRRTRNNVTKVIKNKKRKYFSTVTEKYKGDSKKLWKEINKFIGRKSTNTDIPNNLNGDDFNEYFVNIGKQISDSFQNEVFIWNHPDSTYTFEFQSVTVEKVRKILSQLSSDSSLDILNFDTKLLRIASPYISTSLSVLFNESLLSGLIPEDWKIARTTPIYKGKGDLGDMTNYRPISVVCHLAKLLEKEIQSQLLLYLQKHNFINIDQYAFFTEPLDNNMFT